MFYRLVGLDAVTDENRCWITAASYSCIAEQAFATVVSFLLFFSLSISEVARSNVDKFCLCRVFNGEPDLQMYVTELGSLPHKSLTAPKHQNFGVFSKNCGMPKIHQTRFSIAFPWRGSCLLPTCYGLGNCCTGFRPESNKLSSTGKRRYNLR